MLQARGQNGRITFDGQTVTIHREGFMAKILVGGGTKSIPVGAITAVQFKRANLAIRGYIQFTMAGGNERRANFGRTTNDAARDENSVVFLPGANDVFQRVADAINAAIQARYAAPAQGYAPPPPDPAQQIQQLAALREQGLISPDEYEWKRRQILDRM